MVAIRRHQAVITGIATGPGVSTFYTDNTDGFPAMLRSFYAGLAGQYPNEISIQVAGEGAIIDDATGVQTGLWTEAVPAPVLGTSASVHAAGTGAVVRWITDLVANGKRVRGRTFMVPLTSAVFEDDGTLSATARNLLLSSASSLIQDANMLFRVWHRPSLAGPGSSGRVVDRAVTDRVAFLTSRRQ